MFSVMFVFFATTVMGLTKDFLKVLCPVHKNRSSPPVRLCLVGRGRDQPQWTETPKGDEACRCCMLGAGRPEAGQHSAAHLGPTLHRYGWFG